MRGTTVASGVRCSVRLVLVLPGMIPMRSRCTPYRTACSRLSGRDARLSSGNPSPTLKMMPFGTRRHRRETAMALGEEGLKPPPPRFRPPKAGCSPVCLLVETDHASRSIIVTREHRIPSQNAARDRSGGVLIGCDRPGRWGWRQDGPTVKHWILRAWSLRQARSAVSWVSPMKVASKPDGRCTTLRSPSLNVPISLSAVRSRTFSAS